MYSVRGSYTIRDSIWKLMESSENSDTSTTYATPTPPGGVNICSSSIRIFRWFHQLSDGISDSVWAPSIVRCITISYTTTDPLWLLLSHPTIFSRGIVLYPTIEITMSPRRMVVNYPLLKSANLKEGSSSSPSKQIANAKLLLKLAVVFVSLDW